MEFSELAETDARLRRQFVSTELEACRTAVEMGEFELNSGAVGTAVKELANADKIVQVIRRFLPGVGRKHKAELTEELAQMLATIDKLRSQLRKLRALPDAAQ